MCDQKRSPGCRPSITENFHHGTEEALYAVSGRAKLRTPEGETPLSEGDFVSFPGGPAHQLVNDAQQPFIYLAITVGLGVEIVEYPGKVA